MTQNILIAGAAGYIGGSVLAELLSRSIEPTAITAAARSDEDINTLATLGVNTAKLDASDPAAMSKVVADNKIDIIINTTTSWQSETVTAMIRALGEQRQASGSPKYFIQSSITAMYSPEGAWPYGEIKDSDDVYEKEKELGGQHPVRATNLKIIEEGRANNVETFIIGVPNVYGRGLGPLKKLSVNIPAQLRTALALQAVHKFRSKSRGSATHISDMATLYALLVEAILGGKDIPANERGYYFAAVHKEDRGTFMDGVAKKLYGLGLVKEPTVTFWESYEVGAEKLGFPKEHIRAMMTAEPTIVPVNAYKLGWKPTWTKDFGEDNVEDEVRDILELDSGKRQSLFDSIVAK